MTEMLEKVAGGLRESFKARIAAGAGMSFEETGVSVPSDDVWRSYARAALEAMQEPTEAMCEFAEDNFDRNGDPIAVVWRAMIQAALNEGK